MQTIGERLEEARKRKGISIREASEATKIRSDYLQKFESNAFELNLPDIYVRGFLRTYATYLKLNPDKLLTDLNALGLSAGRESRRSDAREIFGRIDLPEPAPTATEPAREPAPPPARPVPVRTPPPGAVAPASDYNQYIKTGLVVVGAVAAMVVLILVVRWAVSSGEPTTRPPVTPVNPPAVTPVPGSDVLTLIALGNVRVKVTQQSDNRILFDGDLLQGETRAMTKQGKVRIAYDLGHNLQVEIRGQRYNMTTEGYGRNTLE